MVINKEAQKRYREKNKDKYNEYQLTLYYTHREKSLKQKRDKYSLEKEFEIFRNILF